MSDLMSLDELMIHLNSGWRGRPHIVSYQTYKRIEQALDHYLSTGELVEGKWGLERREQNDRQT